MPIVNPSPGGGGSVPPGTVTAVLFYSGISPTTSGNPLTGGEGWQINPAGVVPVDAVAQAYGTIGVVTTAPNTTIAAMGTALAFGGMTFTATDTVGDAYDVEVSILIQNVTGTQSLQLQANKSIARGAGGTVTVLAADLSPTAITGADLAYSAGSGNVTSTAGGSFAVLMAVSGGWD